jgi:hypothetical protein
VRPGIVDLRDLNGRYAWNPLKIPRFIERAGLTPAGAVEQRFAAPQVVIAIVPVDLPELLARSRGWLASAVRVIVACDGAVAHFDEAAWDDVLATFPNAELIPWMSPSEQVERAVALAAGLPEPPPPVAVATEKRELPPSAWTPFRCESRWRAADVIASQLALRDGRAVLLLGDGRHVDLGALPPELVIGDVFAPLRPRDHRQLQPGGQALGFDPVHPVGWRGDRMTVYWSYVADDGPCFLSANDHDWPCGPAKKIMGHMDNDPVQIALAPALDACLWRFEHDVTLTSSIPVRWQRAGAVDVATWPTDPLRAVWFVKDERFEDLTDDDCREVAPAMVLGPDAHQRYALDLSRLVYRIMGKEAVPIGGPDAGYIVCSADHQVVRRGTGRLVGGWFRWATIEADGAYWREDLATGERTPIAIADRVVCDREAAAIAHDALHEGRIADAPIF